MRSLFREYSEHAHNSRWSARALQFLSRSSNIFYKDPRAQYSGRPESNVYVYGGPQCVPNRDCRPAIHPNVFTTLGPVAALPGTGSKCRNVKTEKIVNVWTFSMRSLGLAECFFAFLNDAFILVPCDHGFFCFHCHKFILQDNNNAFDYNDYCSAHFACRRKLDSIDCFI